MNHSGWGLNYESSVAGLNHKLVLTTNSCLLADLLQLWLILVVFELIQLFTLARVSCIMAQQINLSEQHY